MEHFSTTYIKLSSTIVFFFYSMITFPSHPFDIFSITPTPSSHFRKYSSACSSTVKYRLHVHPQQTFNCYERLSFFPSRLRWNSYLDEALIKFIIFSPCTSLKFSFKPLKYFKIFISLRLYVHFKWRVVLFTRLHCYPSF